MADHQAVPLSDDERAELEALRAEKAARDEAERARRERAELEALRAEADAAHARQERAGSQATGTARTPAEPTAPASRRADERPPVVDPDNLTFGQRMVMTPKTDDPDEIPGMPPAQKIIIAAVFVFVIAGAVWIILSNNGMV